MKDSFDFSPDIDAIVSEFLDEKTEADLVSPEIPDTEAEASADISAEISAEDEEPEYIEITTNARETDEPSGIGYIPEYERRQEQKGFAGFLRAFTTLVFSTLSLLLMLFVLVNIHPGAGAEDGSSSQKTRTDLVSIVENFSDNARAKAFDGLAYIRKIYKIPDGETSGPAPDRRCFASTDDKAEVLAVIQKAKESGLLEGQDTVFTADTEVYASAPIKYYYDETLLAICWKEKIDGRVCSFAEVKVGDASQLRRKISDDTYGTSTLAYASELAAQANAVVAMNADFYAARDLGITVYDGTLYRFDESLYHFNRKYNSVDTLFIDSNGDFSYFYYGQQSSREEMEQYIRDNDIRFSVAFGPILVENHEVREIGSYSIGELDREYSRAGIAQCDSRHYLYMAVSHSPSGSPCCTVFQFAEFFASKGVETAYCFDGGQTGELLFDGEVYNFIDYNAERLVSDIVYFATAIPEAEALK